jgi:hypothetical protein
VALGVAQAQAYAPRYRAQWLGKIGEAGVRRRAEFYYQQLDALRLLRQQVRRELLAESSKHKAWKLLCQIPSIGPIRAAQLIAILQTQIRMGHRARCADERVSGVLAGYRGACATPGAVKPNLDTKAKGRSALCSENVDLVAPHRPKLRTVQSSLPTLRKLQSGDMVMIDLRPVVHGYASDSCRTVCVGRASRRSNQLDFCHLDLLKKDM